jgi:hypothetical protein
MHLLTTTIVAFLSQAITTLAQCFSDSDTNTEWAQLINGDTTSTTFSIENSCCQETVCGIGCPEEVPPPPKGFGIAIMSSIALYEIVGVLCFVFIKGKADNFFVAGRTLPVWVRYDDRGMLYVHVLLIQISVH